jgi:hypothetical protein
LSYGAARLSSGGRQPDFELVGDRFSHSKFDRIVFRVTSRGSNFLDEVPSPYRLWIKSIVECGVIFDKVDCCKDCWSREELDMTELSG